jgi:hypothetical protein
VNRVLLIGSFVGKKYAIQDAMPIEEKNDEIGARLECHLADNWHN